MALQQLLDDGGDAEDYTISTIGTSRWYLGAPGNMIHRFAALASAEASTRLIEEVKTAADQMNHHPHIATSEQFPIGDHENLTWEYHPKNDTWNVLFTNTTHRPAGLSLRDVRLAQRINEILSAHETTVPVLRDHEPQRRSDQWLADTICRARRELIEKNLASIPALHPV